MIADPNRHVEQETLKALLDETLSGDQAERVESHLCQCDVCRGNLERIAGDQSWWEETASVLSDSTLAPRPDPTAPRDLPKQDVPEQDLPAWRDDSLDPSIDWIRPLLDRSDESALGQLDQYPVDGVIGQGGMGVVLRGTDPELHRPVAIKLLSPHLAGVGAARARFMREAQAAAAIIHPSIVPIYSIATAGRLPYIVMPLIAGGNLQERLNEEGPLELLELLRIALQIAEGLAAAHRHGVIHRDIKPANILVEEGNGRVLISDFGLARALDDATLTMSGMIAGTPQFMSPEQARGDVVDARSDLFSLGSLMYALATGRPPFRAESPLAVLRKISESKPRPVHEINERVPAWLDQIVAWLMQVDRNRRIQSADDAVDLLRNALSHARSPSTVPLPKTIQPKWRHLKLAAAIMIPLALVSAGAFTWQSNFGQRSAQRAIEPTRTATTRFIADTPPIFGLEWDGQSIDEALASIHGDLDQLSEELSDQDVLDESPADMNGPDPTLLPANTSILSTESQE